MRKMKIGIDCDEVLGNLIDPYRDFIRGEYGKDIKREEITSFDLWKVFGTTIEEDRQRRGEFFNSKYFDRISPIEGSQEGINVLSRRNELYVITSRPILIKDKTMNFIERYFLNAFSGIYHTDEVADNCFARQGGGNRTMKADVCKMLGVKVLIEDCLDKAVQCADEGVNVLLFDAPWNQNGKLPENVMRVKNWKEILEKLK